MSIIQSPNLKVLSSFLPFKFYKYLYLFILADLLFVVLHGLSLVAVSGVEASLLCSAWASHCRGFSCGRACDLHMQGLQYLWHMRALVAACRF